MFPRNQKRSFRTTILIVVLLCSVLGAGLSILNVRNYSELKRLEEAGNATITAVRESQAQVNRTSRVYLNNLDVLALRQSLNISSFQLQPLLTSQDLFQEGLKQIITAGGLTRIMAEVAPHEEDLEEIARRHLNTLQALDSVMSKLHESSLRMLEQAPDEASTASLEMLARELPELMLESSSLSNSLLVLFKEKMVELERRQSLIFYTSTAICCLVALLCIALCSRILARPIEKLTAVVEAAEFGPIPEVVDTGFVEIDRLQSAFTSLIGIRDIKESELEERVASQLKHLRQSEADLLHIQKMEQMGQLTGGMAHDFRNLLTVLRGQAELIVNSIDDRGAALECVEEIILICDRAEEMTERMVAFSAKKPSVEVTPLVVSNWLLECAILLRPFQNETQDRILFESEPHMPKVMISSATLDQVMMNLVSNSSEAIGDEGGNIHVRCYRHRSEVHGELPKDVQGQAGAVVIEVHDNGSGIPEAIRSRIFDPYFTTKHASLGTGFGLSIVYRLVHQNGGVVQFDSEPGSGTTFRVFLPAAAHMPDNHYSRV